MALPPKINLNAKAEINSGFGSNTADYGGRFVNKDGTPNIEKKGIGYFGRISWYHTMLQMPRWKFFGLLILFYITMNFIFACIYYSIGIEKLEGSHTGSAIQNFSEAYFFSAQTFTTVGYGRISPHGFTASSIAALEALIGLLSFAIATGLFYGRFSKPKAFVRFSKHAILAPYKDGTALMMRVAPYKNNNLSEAEAKVTVGLTVEENGEVKNKFFPLELEFDKVNALSLSWTIVHPINERSPFYGFSKEDFASTNGEMLVYLKAFDDKFSNTVIARTSYTLQEVVIGARFNPMYHRDEIHNKTVLDLEKLDSYRQSPLSPEGGT
ncbi:MAG: ion channel [Ferruginibacter sp.]